MSDALGQTDVADIHDDLSQSALPRYILVWTVTHVWTVASRRGVKAVEFHGPARR